MIAVVQIAGNMLNHVISIRSCSLTFGYAMLLILFELLPKFGAQPCSGASTMASRCSPCVNVTLAEPIMVRNLSGRD
jgi:hypothetical protein